MFRLIGPKLSSNYNISVTYNIIITNYVFDNICSRAFYKFASQYSLEVDPHRSEKRRLLMETSTKSPSSNSSSSSSTEDEDVKKNKNFKIKSKPLQKQSLPVLQFKVIQNKLYLYISFYISLFVERKASWRKETRRYFWNQIF